MLRPSEDPITEVLRQEAVDRYRPMIVFLAVAITLICVAAILVLIFLGLHALLTRCGVPRIF